MANDTGALPIMDPQWTSLPEAALPRPPYRFQISHARLIYLVDADALQTRVDRVSGPGYRVLRIPFFNLAFLVVFAGQYHKGRSLGSACDIPGFLEIAYFPLAAHKGKRGLHCLDIQVSHPMPWKAWRTFFGSPKDLAEIRSRREKNNISFEVSSPAPECKSLLRIAARAERGLLARLLGSGALAFYRLLEAVLGLDRVLFVNGTELRQARITVRPKAGNATTLRLDRAEFTLLREWGILSGPERALKPLQAVYSEGGYFDLHCPERL